MAVSVAEVVEGNLALIALETVVGIGRWSVNGVDVAVRFGAGFLDSVEVVASWESAGHVFWVVIFI